MIHILYIRICFIHFHCTLLYMYSLPSAIHVTPDPTLMFSARLWLNVAMSWLMSRLLVLLACTRAMHRSSLRCWYCCKASFCHLYMYSQTHNSVRDFSTSYTLMWEVHENTACRETQANGGQRNTGKWWTEKHRQMVDRETQANGGQLFQATCTCSWPS